MDSKCLRVVQIICRGFYTIIIWLKETEKYNRIKRGLCSIIVIRAYQSLKADNSNKPAFFMPVHKLLEFVHLRKIETTITLLLIVLKLKVYEQKSTYTLCQRIAGRYY